MTVLNVLQSGLYLLMNALLYPVIVLLIGLVIAVLFILGGFVSELVLRRRQAADSDSGSQRLASRVADDLADARFASAAAHIDAYACQQRVDSRLLQDFLQDMACQVKRGRAHLGLRAENALRRQEIQMAALLDKTRFMIRIAPMLGLMGTLIPMGPALVALTQGDLKQMANCLIIAFGTTVAGLAVGALAYVISMVRERWYARDLMEMESILDLMAAHIDAADVTVTGDDAAKAAVLPMPIA